MQEQIGERPPDVDPQPVGHLSLLPGPRVVSVVAGGSRAAVAKLALMAGFRRRNDVVGAWVAVHDYVCSIMGWWAREPCRGKYSQATGRRT